MTATTTAEATGSNTRKSLERAINDAHGICLAAWIRDMRDNGYSWRKLEDICEERYGVFVSHQSLFNWFHTNTGRRAAKGIFKDGDAR